MSDLGDLETGGDDGPGLRRDLETGLMMNYILNRYRRRHPHGPVKASRGIWAILAVSAAVGLAGSLADIGWMAGPAWALFGFVVLCNGMRHAL